MATSDLLLSFQYIAILSLVSTNHTYSAWHIVSVSNGKTYRRLTHARIPSLAPDAAIAAEITPLLIPSPCGSAISPTVLLEHCCVACIPSYHDVSVARVCAKTYLQMNSGACPSSVVGILTIVVTPTSVSTCTQIEAVIVGHKPWL